MASAIPLAVSLLSTMASTHPGLHSLQQSLPSFTSMASSGTQTSAPSSTPSAPVNIPAPPASTNGNTGIATTPPHNSTSNFCETCHIKPKYNDGTKTHPYCSKGCANKSKNNRSTNNGTNGQNNGNNGNHAGSANCDVCHIRPKYNDGTKTHPFCGKACAKKANGGGGKSICRAPGCQKPTYTTSNGTQSEFCSLAHKTLVETICILCLQAPKQPGSHFCSKTCSDDAESQGPIILEVPQGHVTFKSVAEQFKTSWRHAGTSCPPVKHVYKIMSTPASLANYNAYRAGVETRGQFVASGRSAGNENRRWHGTRRECNLGDPGQTAFCSSTTCSLCCIVRTSYELRLFGKKTGWGRFGRGIYTSSTSSKSNDYSSNDCKSSLKAMLLNKVVVGKGCKMLHDNTSLQAPPAGFDSVLAEKGGSLNYDELVVYTNDAIRPSFLVMYEP
ncbi:hypothetical protein PTI98_010529 [Pleurotus ostreatus]|nr:hypothetical protein PTI98_010529 [Pleurotus ostreatus]